MRATVHFIAVLLLAGISVAADGSGDADASIYIPPPSIQEVHSPYWTKENTALVVMDAAAKSTDMYFTMRNAGRPDFRENNPLARPFVTHGPVVAGVSQGLLFAGEVLMSYELNRHGHHKMAKVLLLVGIGGNTAGIATSKR